MMGLTEKDLESHLCFYDFETTDLNKRVPTELSMIAISVNNFLNDKGEVPRTLRKLTIPFNPMIPIHPGASMVSGFHNDMLKAERTFDMVSANLVDNFLMSMFPDNIWDEETEKWICLIAHNGDNFDLDILKSHMASTESYKHTNIYTLDTLKAFKAIDAEIMKQNCPGIEKTARDIFKSPAKKISSDESEVRLDGLLDIFAKAESPVKSVKVNETPPSPSYRLGSIYQRIYNSPIKNAHNAEADTIATLKIAQHYGRSFLDYLIKNKKNFNPTCDSGNVKI